MKIALTTGSKTFGWSVLSENLRKSLGPLRSLPDNITLHAISGPSFESIMLDAWNRYNIGIGFIENNVQALQFLDHAKRYDLIIAGSTWMERWMKDAGLTNVIHLVQGIDPQVFRPVHKRTPDGRFVVGCFTKAEYRKGTDILIAAMARMQQKYKNVWFVCGCDNIWPHSFKTLMQSPYIRFEQGRTVRESLVSTLAANGMDLQRVVFHAMVENRFMPGLYGECDLGAHVSRCEAGEGQVLKEMICCGLPTVATFSTGQTDILVDYPDELLVVPTKDADFTSDKGDVLGRWPEPTVDQVFDRLEHAYRHGAPDVRRESFILRCNTWDGYAKELLERIEEAVK